MAISVAGNSFVYNDSTNGIRSYTGNSYTVGSGTDRAVVVFLSGCSGNTSSGQGVSSITLGGNTADATIESSISSRVWSGGYVFLNPATGAQALAITTNGNQRALLAHAVELTGVDQTSPVTWSNGSSDSPTPRSTDLNRTTVDNDAMHIASLATRAGDATTFSVTNGGTEIDKADTGTGGTTNVEGISAYEAPATAGNADFTISWTGNIRRTYVQMELKPATGGSGQTITGSAYTDPDTFGTNVLTTGPVTITGSAYTDPDIFGANAVSPGPVTITGSTYVDPDTFGAHTIAPGAVTITGAVYVDPDSFGNNVVSLASGPQTITGAAYVDPDTFGANVVSPGPVTITGSAYTDPDAFGAHTIAPGVVTITGAAYADPDAFGAHVISPGPVTISGTAYADPDIFGNNVVALASGPQTIIGSFYVDPDSFGANVVSGGAVAIAKVPVDTPASRTLIIVSAPRSMIILPRPRSMIIPPRPRNMVTT